MLPSTSSRLRQGPTHVTDTGRCPTPCPNLTEVARLGQLSLCCSQSGASPSSWVYSVLFPALRLSRAAVCAATKLSVRCSQDLFNFRTTSVLRPDRRGEPVVTCWGKDLINFIRVVVLNAIIQGPINRIRTFLLIHLHLMRCKNILHWQYYNISMFSTFVRREMMYCSSNDV